MVEFDAGCTKKEAVLGVLVGDRWYSRCRRGLAVERRGVSDSEVQVKELSSLLGLSSFTQSLSPSFSHSSSPHCHPCPHIFFSLTPPFPRAPPPTARTWHYHRCTRTHKVMSSLGVQGAAVTDDEVVDAMHVAWDTVKLMLEPSGAVALAALLHGRIDLPADESLAVGITASGANITMADYMQIVKGRTTVSRS